MGFRAALLLLVFCVMVSGCSGGQQDVVLEKLLKIDGSTPPVTLYIGGDESRFCDISITPDGLNKAMEPGGYTITRSGGKDFNASCSWDGYHVLSVRPEHKTTATVLVYADQAGTRNIWLEGSFVQVGRGAEVTHRLNVSTPNPIALLKAEN